MKETSDCRGIEIDVSGSISLKNISQEGDLFYIIGNGMPRLLGPGEETTFVVSELSTIRISPYAPAGHADFEICGKTMSAPRSSHFRPQNHVEIIKMIEHDLKREGRMDEGFR